MTFIEKHKIHSKHSIGKTVCSCFILGIALLTFAFQQKSFGQDESSGFQVYKLDHRKAEDVEKSLLQLLEEYGDEVHLVADTRRNQLLLQGPKEAHTKTKKLISAIDQPGEKSNPVIRAYPVPQDKMEQTLEDLRIKYARQKDVRIASDPGNEKIIVLATEAVQKEILANLQKDSGESDSEEPQLIFPENKAPTAKKVKITKEISAGSREIILENINNKLLTNRLIELLGQKFQAAPSKDPTVDYFQFVSSSRERTDLFFNKVNQSVKIEGNTKYVRQLSYLVQMIDDPPKGKNNQISIVPLDQTQKEKVREAIRKYKERVSRLREAPAVPRNKENVINEKNSRSELHEKNSNGIQLVQFQFVPSAALAQQNGANPPGPNNANGGDSEELRELGGDVSIETLDDIDVIIIRGGDHDIKELTRIIEEIEKISEESQPEVFVYQLKHVESSSVAVLTSTVSADLVGNRQGRVNVISLNKPNAVLVIGWGEAFKAMKNLIAQIDQPVDPNMEVHVYRLKHAPALGIRSTILEFLQNRGNTPGLETKANVIADASSNSLIVKASPRDLAEIKLLIDRLDKPDSDTVNEVRVFKLKNTLATDLATTIRAAILSSGNGTAATPSTSLEFFPLDAKTRKKVKSGLLNNVQITPDPRTNSLFVTAPAQSMELIAALIQQLDAKPTDVAQIKVFPVVNGDANELVLMLRSLLPSQPAARVTPQLTNAEGESSLTPLRFAVDDRTNSIIAAGSKGELEIVRALLLRLDEDKVKQRQNQVYRLKNAPAIDVAQTINDFLRSEQRVQQAADTGVSRFRQMEREVIVVAEKVSNSLVISATPQYFDDILELVEDLDRQPPQVMIQVLIAEVTLNDLDEFGVELGIQDSVLFDRSLLGDLVTTTNTFQESTPAGIITSTQEIIQAASNVPGFNFNNQELGNSGSTNSLSTAGSVGGQALSNFAVGRINPQTGYGGLVLSASSENVSVLVRALQESRRLEVLSRPQVMTLDNQPAYIQVGQRVPRITESSQTVYGLVNSIVLENVGLILGVRPRISPEGLVVMDIDAEKSELGNDADGIPISTSTDGTVIRSPRIDLTQASTTVSASSGETIVLGGLITNGTQDVHRRVPWLSDIPVLGHLFRYDSIINRRRELLIIMTPYVVRTPEDAEMLKNAEASRMHWCSADVHELLGSGQFCDQKDCPICNQQIPVIYPDMNPRGILPETIQDNSEIHYHQPHEHLHEYPAEENQAVPELKPLPSPPLPSQENQNGSSTSYAPQNFNQNSLRPINQSQPPGQNKKVTKALFAERNHPDKHEHQHDNSIQKNRKMVIPDFPEETKAEDLIEIPDAVPPDQHLNQTKRPTGGRTGKWNPRKRIPWWRSTREKEE